jgi:ubiquinone/menaquinone biosynthesis C-methylase UbiE
MRDNTFFCLVPWIAPYLLCNAAWKWAEAFPADPPTKGNGVARRHLLTLPIGVGGAIIYGNLVADASQKFSRGDLVYPDAHEKRVASTIGMALSSSISTRTGDDQSMDRHMRVLEIGIGKDCRLIRRNLYLQAYREAAASRRISIIDLTGVDISSPSESTLKASEESLSHLDKEYHMSTDFRFVKGNISQGLEFPDGFFDCIISSLTLCSVEDQEAALKEIKRLIRPEGGTFGYIEHTAVLPSEPYRVLELQQRLFDSLQQALADNCHLRRYTDSNILEIFGRDESRIIASERYLVDEMWPVSCQSCGVVQRIRV